MKEMQLYDNKPAGVWRDEPDKVQWVDEATGLDCLIRRVPDMFHLCGYVGVPETHPAFGKDYNDVTADVHGGLTFSDSCNEHDPHGGICHVPEPGRPDRVWWFGFDCAHCDDLSPGSRRGFAGMIEPDGEEYRDIEFVKAECASLAKQLATMA